jgi:transcriptional regulator with XRE-family HTH domain
MIEPPEITPAEKAERIRETLGLSRPQFAAHAGLKFGTLNKQLNKGQDLPWKTIDAICCAFNIPHKYFSRDNTILSIQPDPMIPDLPKSFAPSVTQFVRMHILEKYGRLRGQDVMDWVDEQGGEISDLDGICQAVDIYQPMTPEENIPKPLKLGPVSLSTRLLEIQDENHFERRLTTFNSTILDNVKAAHLRVSQESFPFDDVTFEGMIDGKKVTVRYRRLIRRVKMKGVGDVTLLHAEQLSL